LRQLLLEGPAKQDFKEPCWDLPSVQRLIRERFGVDYSQRHLGRIMDELGFSRQKPQRQAQERDEASVQAWQEQDWPSIVDQAQREERAIVFIDESGFMLQPTLQRPWAPKGQTPVLVEPAKRDRLSVIAALVLYGPSNHSRLLFETQSENFKGADVAAFLEHLGRSIPLPLLIVWDNASIHRSQEVKDLVTRDPDRYRLHPLPPYAPESLEELEPAVLASLRRQRHRQELIEAVLKQADLPFDQWL
jgi:transposase